MNLSMGGYLKLGSSGGVEAVFIVIPPVPIDPDIPMEDIPNAMVDEYGRFLLDSFGRNIIAQKHIILKDNYEYRNYSRRNSCG